MEKRLPILALASLTLFIWTFHQPFVRSGALVFSQTLAAVGVKASVEPNVWNNLAAQIDAKQKELDAREAALSTKEQALEASGSSSRLLSPEWYTTALALILLVLVLLNFYLDWRHREPSVTA